MNKTFPFITIGERLKRSFLQSVSLVFILGAMAFFANKIVINKQLLEDSLIAQSRIIGSNCTAAVIFQDEKNAEEILKSLEYIQNVREGYILFNNGDPFVHYLRKGATPAHFSSTLMEFGINWDLTDLYLLQPILHNQRPIAMIYLRYDFTSILKTTLIEIFVVFGFLVILVFFSFILFSKTEKTISEPIQNLVKTMEIISESKNYSLCVSESGTGEISILAKSFNEMLEQIQKWNAELNDHKNNLEMKVSERTEQLNLLNRKLEEELSQRRITEAELRKKTEELTLASEALRRALEAEKRFLASVSHEIRTPMNFILGTIQILCETPLEITQAKLVENAYKSSILLLNLINDVLDVSKIDAGQMEFEKGEIMLKPLLMECLDLVAGNMKGNVELDHQIPDFPDVYLGDATRIKQIFLNLLGNSTKFTKKGFIKLYLVEKTESAPMHDQFKFCIEDSGIGIPRDRINSLGIPFRQFHGNNYGGSGLGIYLSRAIARYMNGGLMIESEEKIGTKVYVWFTLEKKPAAELTIKNLPPDRVRENFSELRVLLVEDESLNAIIAQKLLSTFFRINDVDNALNGIEAVRKAEGNRYDIIFMDIQMPEMDGVRATEEIRKSDKTTPIVALSAHAIKTEIDRALNAGMNDYVTKPIRPERLGEIFSRYCQKSRP